MSSSLSSTAVDPRTCFHCFCKRDTGGVWYCCKCGIRLTEWRVYSLPRCGNANNSSIVIRIAEDY